MNSKISDITFVQNKYTNPLRIQYSDQNVNFSSKLRIKTYVNVKLQHTLQIFFYSQFRTLIASLIPLQSFPGGRNRSLLSRVSFFTMSSNTKTNSTDRSTADDHLFSYKYLDFKIYCHTSSKKGFSVITTKLLLTTNIIFLEARANKK